MEGLGEITWCNSTFFYKTLLLNEQVCSFSPEIMAYEHGSSEKSCGFISRGGEGCGHCNSSLCLGHRRRTAQGGLQGLRLTQPYTSKSEAPFQGFAVWRHEASPWRAPLVSGRCFSRPWEVLIACDLLVYTGFSHLCASTSLLRSCAPLLSCSSCK